MDEEKGGSKTVISLEGLRFLRPVLGRVVGERIFTTHEIMLDLPGGVKTGLGSALLKNKAIVAKSPARQSAKGRGKGPRERNRVPFG